MLYLTLSPHVYYPNESEVTKKWLVRILNNIRESYLSVVIIGLEHYQFFTDEFDLKSLLLDNTVFQLLKMLENQDIVSFIKVNNSMIQCNEVIFTPDIFEHFPERNSFYDGICLSYNKFGSQDILIPEFNQLISKTCSCKTGNDFQDISDLECVNSEELFGDFFKKRTVKTSFENVVVEDEEQIQSCIFRWYRDRYFKFNTELHNIIIPENFVEDVIVNRKKINMDNLIGSIVRAKLAPSYIHTSKDSELLIEAHPNKTSSNESQIKVSGESFDITRAYVLAENQVTNGKECIRIVYTNHNNMMILLCLVVDHDVKDSKIKIAISDYLA